MPVMEEKIHPKIRAFIEMRGWHEISWDRVTVSSHSLVTLRQGSWSVMLRLWRRRAIVMIGGPNFLAMGVDVRGPGYGMDLERAWADVPVGNAWKSAVKDGRWTVEERADALANCPIPEVVELFQVEDEDGN